MKISSIILLAAMTIGIGSASAQSLGGKEIEVRVENRIEGKGSKKSSKKEQRAIENEIAFQSALGLVKSRNFVMEATKLSMPDGSSLAVFSDVNYVMMKGDRAVVQSTPGISGGPNGMGGITLEGMVVDLRETVDKRGNLSLKFTVMSTGGSAEVELKLLTGGNSANATITPKMRTTNRVIMFGRIIDPEKSRVFKGFSM
ncbi:MAG: DUF4251 domain-containing protein [Alistipes sp.]|nr:DUF4251 domain-containing protein [Alistipes sp.]